MTDDVDSWKRRSTPGGAMAPFLATARSASRRIDALETRAPLEYAAVSKGGLRIRDGGALTVLDGGDVVVQDGGQLRVVSEEGRKIAFDDGTMWLSYSPQDTAYGSIAAGVAADGQRSAVWIKPPARSAVKDGNENSIVVEGRGVAGQTVGGVFITTLGRLQGTAEADIYLGAATGIALRGGAGISMLGEAGPVAISSNNQVSISSGPGQQMLLRPGGSLFLKANGTTTVAANCYISGSGADVALYQVSSSRRYKSDIADHHTDQAALLAARPVSWRDKAEVEADPDTTARYVGFIAEELDDLGLTEYVTYNPDGSPESVAYDRMVIGLLDLAKTQAQQIAWLAQRVAAQTGQVMPDFAPDPTAPITATRPAPAPEPAPDPDTFPDHTQEA